MSVTVKKVNSYQNFGACIHIANDHMELYATIDKGPRVIHCSLLGGENLFWADTKSVAVVNTPGLDKAFGKGDDYHILGGHRLWASPEHVLNSYYPDDEPVAYEMTPSGCILTAPVQKVLGLQFSLEISMDPNAAKVTVLNRITNKSGKAVTLAPWAITQLDPGGLEVFPQSKEDTGLLADRVYVVWPYTDMGDKRLTWADDYISIRPDNTLRSCKIGCFNRKGYALYLNKGAVYKKVWNPILDAEYPDYGCNFETFTNEHFIEMESLAPLTTLKNGESATHSEDWLCFAEPDNLDEDGLLKKYGG